jgi:hypothetical protein
MEMEAMPRLLTLAAAAGLACMAAAAAAQMGTRPPVEGPHDTTAVTPTKDVTSAGTFDNQANQMANAMRSHAAARHGTAPASASDIVVGSQVSDSRGRPVGAISRIELDGAVVTTAGGAVRVPLDAFGRNEKGLVIAITKSQFDALVAKAQAAPAG